MYDNLKEEINQFIINAKRNATRYMPNRYPELCEWLILTYSAPLAESAYLWLTETTKPTCPECGNHPRFVSFTKGHLTFCSSKCSNSSNETKKKAVATTFERFGVDNASKSDEIKLKKIKASIEKYGVDYVLQAPEIRTQIEKTNIEKYGVPCVFLNDIIQEQIKKTNIELYGVENPAQCDEIKNRIKNTKIANGTQSADIDDFTLYKRTVWNITERSWRKYKDILDESNIGISMRGFHLDHMFSITEAYNNNIPPEHVGHVCNLQLLSAIDNKQKFTKCSHTYTELLEKINRWRD